MGDAPALGGEVAGYHIESLLGEGGMGTVYLAERPQGGRCALKVLSRRPGVDPSFATRFKREVEYAQALDHPHIVELYDAGETPDGVRYLAMQYVPGGDLRALLAREGVLDLARALSILRQVGDALDCAHANGLIHRDVKPGNILVDEDGAGGVQAYLTDFGLSKNPAADSIVLTNQGQFIGTTAYTAPEEILAQPRDHLVDVYSLGCVLFETLAGEPPFVRERELDVLYAHVGDPRPAASAHNPQLAPEIDAIVARAMAISPKERYGSCAEFIAAASAFVPGGAAATVGEPAPSAVAAPDVEELGPGAALRLAIRSGVGLGSEILVEDELALGRLSTLGGALARDSDISRQHCRVHRQPDGGFVVEDEGSTNGTFVNEERIGGPHPLRPGDELRIGSTIFAVSAAPAVADTTAPEPAEEPAPAPPPEPLSEPELEIAPEPEPEPELEIAPEPEPEPAAAPPPRAPLVLRLALDLEAGELEIAIEDGATARITHDGDGWRVVSE